MTGLNRYPSIRILAALALALYASVPPAAAQTFRPLETATPGTVPGGMNYQGRLEKDGFPVTGDKTMRFQLFDASSGGVALWDSGDQTVTVTQGIFAQVLSIPTSSLNGTAQRYLEVTVDGVTLVPRDPIRTVPYAAIAETVEGNIEISTAGLNFQVGAIAALVISSITSNIGIGSTNSPAQFSVTPQSDDSLIVQISSQDASAVMVVNSQGLMGLGTNSPSSLIDARSVDSALLRLHADTDNNSGNADSGVIFVNNANTQIGQIIYDESADVVTMGYGNANQHVNIDNTGRVGIGAATPQTKLHLFEATGGVNKLHITNSDTGITAADGVDVGLDASENFVLGTYEASQMRFFTNGLTTPDMAITSGGNVGIGTVDAQTALEVNGAAQFGSGAAKSTFTATGALQLNTDAGLSVGTTFFVGNGRVGVGTVVPLTTFEVDGNAQFGSGGTKSTFTATGALSLNTNATLSVGTTFFVNNGRVGIGTNAPGAPLHQIRGGAVASPAVQTDGQARFQNSGAAASNAIIEVITGDTGNGQICFGDTASACQGSVGYDNGSNRLALGVLGTSTYMTIDSGGSVGIGTQVPATLLDVAGSAQFGNVGTKSGFTTAGALTMASGANITMVGTGKIQQPQAPTVGDDLANKTYVDGNIGLSTFWNRDAINGEVYPKTIADQLGVGTQDPSKLLHVLASGTAGTPASTADTIAVFQKTGGGESGAIEVLSNSGGTATVYFGDEGGASRGSVQYLNTTDSIQLGTNGTPNRLVIDNAGAVSIGGALTAATINTGSGAFEIGQNLRTTDAVTFTTVNTGNGANELFAMNQDVQTTDAVTFATVNTGNGANELFAMDQNVRTTDAPTFATVNTGNGANELFAMNQNVRTTDSPTFAQINTGPGATEVQLMNQNIRTSDAVSFAGITTTAHLRLLPRTIAQLLLITPTAVGEMYFCTDCTPATVGKIVVSTNTGAGNFADALGGTFQ